MFDKFKAVLKNSVGYIISTLLTAGYIALSILEIDRTGKSVGEIIGSGFAFYIYQIVLTTVFRAQGLANGRESEQYKNTVRLHGQKVESISDDMDMLPYWCDEKNRKNYEQQRKKILGRAALKYADYFDKNGDVITLYEVDADKMSLKWKNRFNRRQEKNKLKAFNKAVNLKLTELDASSITSADKAKEDKYALPDSEKEFMGKHSVVDIVFKALPAIVFGLYGAKELATFSWAVFAWTVFQALVGFASAIPQMFTAKSYIVNDVRTGVVKKITWVDDFSADVKKHPEKYKKEACDECGDKSHDDGNDHEEKDECV